MAAFVVPCTSLCGFAQRGCTAPRRAAGRTHLPPQPTSRLRCAALRCVDPVAALRCAARAQRPSVRRVTRAAAGDGDNDKEPERDEGACRVCALTLIAVARAGADGSCRVSDGLYIGTFSNFFSDPAQLKGVVLFCGVLASFFSLGNIGAALLLPVLCVPCTLRTSAQTLVFRSAHATGASAR